MKKFVAGAITATIIYVLLSHPDIWSGKNASDAVAPAVEKLAAPETTESLLWWRLLWWSPVVLIVAVCIAGVMIAFAVARNKWRLIYPRDGAYPVVQMNNANLMQRLRGISQAVFLPVDMIGQEAVSVTMYGDGETVLGTNRPDWNSQHQLEFAKGAQKGRMTTGAMGVGGIRNSAQAKLASGWYDKPAHVVDAKSVPIIAPVARQLPMWSARDVIRLNTPTSFALGLTDENEIIAWDVENTPHIRVHGKTQGSGKTNLIKQLIVGAALSHAHCIVLDRRGFKDWSAYAPYVELIDNRQPGAFVGTCKQLQAIYQERDELLGNAGVGNLAGLRNAPGRVFVVISEFGSACRAAADSGELETVVHSLKSILSEAGATGVHMIFEDQAVNRNWPPELRGNAEPITGYLPEDTSKQGGYSKAYELDRYQFHYDGERFKTFDMATEADGLLAGCTKLSKDDYMIDARSFVRSVDSDNSPGEMAKNINFVPNERTNEPKQPTDLQSMVVAWRKANPDGTQADMRREFEASGQYIAKGYASELWRACPVASDVPPDHNGNTLAALIAQYGEVEVNGERVTKAVDKTQEIRYK